MDNALNSFWDIATYFNPEDEKKVKDAFYAGDIEALESFGFRLCQMGNFGKIWLGRNFSTNFYFLHWEWKCSYTHDTQTHGKLAAKSGVSRDRIPQLNPNDGRFTDGTVRYPSEDELRKLAECYQVPVDALKGKYGITQEDRQRNHRSI